ncbi:hypothetical protein DEU56DRAFT_806639 [Suillus clintonianus]|uniref:uncharacterized protein n=1 Tax=Suillus clintonianus TaxID=1904413 RepID=UPI001B8661B6|nr:uncharacterized protein DEU56DRAFT_806639 [Suillus clintonianus]KAG2135810.1 hypothetical protein DEU56DRAFT_806639 [Suillus clintonianus]
MNTVSQIAPESSEYTGDELTAQTNVCGIDFSFNRKTTEEDTKKIESVIRLVGPQLYYDDDTMDESESESVRVLRSRKSDLSTYSFHYWGMEAYATTETRSPPDISESRSFPSDKPPSHKTSFDVHARADSPEVFPRVSIQRRRSLDGLVQADSDPIQRHNQHRDGMTRSTSPDARPVASSSSENNINANTLQQETIQQIAEMSAAKTLELFTLHGELPGSPPITNTYNGCIVRPRGRAAHTVNFGGKNNKGAAVLSSTGTVSFGGTDNGGEAVDPSPTSEADRNSLHTLDDDPSLNGYQFM